MEVKMNCTAAKRGKNKCTKANYFLESLTLIILIFFKAVHCRLVQFFPTQSLIGKIQSSKSCY